MSETLDPAQSLSHTKAFVSGLAINLSVAVNEAAQKAGSDEATILAESKAAFKAALAEFPVGQNEGQEISTALTAVSTTKSSTPKKAAARPAAKK